MYSELRDYLALSNDSPTGLVWLKQASSRALVGQPAFTNLSTPGYYQGGFKGGKLYAHRVVFYLVHGWWPDKIDHRNGIRTDNRPRNLRSVTTTQNGQNRVVRGTRYHTGRKLWQARITYGGRCHSLGYFATEPEAHAAYLQAKLEHHNGATPRCFADT